MGVTLDGQILFEDHRLEIEIGSFRRDSVETAVPGLDGVLSIDLGQRSRQIKQTGVLRSKSQPQMDSKISAISAYMDGDTHKLVTCDGRQFDNLRMDVFKVSKERMGGSGVELDYEILYTQLNI